MKTDTGDLALLVFERRSAAAAHHHAHPVWWLRTLLAWIPAQRGCFRKWAGRALSLVIDIQARIPSSINIRSSIGSGIDVTHFSGVDYLDSVDPGREGDPGEVGAMLSRWNGGGRNCPRPSVSEPVRCRRTSRCPTTSSSPFCCTASRSTPLPTLTPYRSPRASQNSCAASSSAGPTSPHRG